MILVLSWVPILHMRRLSLREMKELVQYYTSKYVAKTGVMLSTTQAYYLLGTKLSFL